MGDMRNLLFVVLAFALGGAGIWFFMNKPDKSGIPAALPTPAVSSASRSAEPSRAAAPVVAAPKPSASVPEIVQTPVGNTSAESISAKATPKVEVKDGVDGNIAQPGDDGEIPLPTKAAPPLTLAGVKTPSVWLVASDLKDLPSSGPGKNNFEVGNPEGKKTTPWKNRSGARFGDGVRARASTTATYVPGLSTSTGSYDAVALCAPGAKECMGSQPTQLKVGLDVNHKDHWLSGPDKVSQSRNGGGSFTVLFVAARGSSSGNPLLENQGGETAGNKSVFFGWVGPDLVGSIHGLSGVVGASAVSTPDAFTSGVHPQIYSLRFDRQKSELKLFSLGEKNSETAGITLPKGEGPDNDQYAAIAMGSKNPGTGAITYVFEHATYSRALGNQEICAIHKEWNQKYGLKIPAAKLKPCVE